MEKSIALGVPQLSNEMQLSIMNKVKNGELSIDDAISQARKNNLELFHQKEQQATQYNFSVHKSNRYRWQKRVLQVDFNTKMVCSIEKGIIKRQLPFAIVKNCHDGAGTRFSISFKGRHDYELEATSMQDKQKILQLVNQIIHSNIYSQPADSEEDVYQVPSVPKRLRQGQLLLQRGGMASFKWKRYEAHLHAGQLTLLPWTPKAAEEGDVAPSPALPAIIHFSDGKARVETSHSFDMFLLHTHCSTYQFRIPVTDGMPTADIQRERDSWVQAIGKLCKKWRSSQSEPTYEMLPEVKEPGAAPGPWESTDAGPLYDTLPQGRGPTDAGLLYDILPQGQGPTDAGLLYDTLPQGRGPTDAGLLYDTLPQGQGPTGAGLLYDTLPQGRGAVTGGEVVPTAPTRVRTFPLPSTPAQDKTCSPVPLPCMPPTSPLYSSLHPLAPPPPPAPAPPPPRRKKTIPPKERTKAFHWDLVAQDKIDKSFWTCGVSGKAKIDTFRLFEQFRVKVSENVADSVDSNHHVEIMLNPKIAHNFSYFIGQITNETL